MKLSLHAQVWLEKHPNRSPEWLRKMYDEGFHIHHVDMLHANNHPENLVLIEGVDHLMLHGRSEKMLDRIRNRVRKPRKTYVPIPPEDRKVRTPKIKVPRTKRVKPEITTESIQTSIQLFKQGLSWEQVCKKLFDGRIRASRLKLAIKDYCQTSEIRWPLDKRKI